MRTGEEQIVGEAQPRVEEQKKEEICSSQGQKGIRSDSEALPIQTDKKQKAHAQYGT